MKLVRVIDFRNLRRGDRVLSRVSKLSDTWYLFTFLRVAASSSSNLTVKFYIRCNASSANMYSSNFIGGIYFKVFGEGLIDAYGAPLRNIIGLGEASLDVYNIGQQ